MLEQNERAKVKFRDILLLCLSHFRMPVVLDVCKTNAH